MSAVKRLAERAASCHSDALKTAGYVRKLGVAFVGLLLVLHLLRTAQGQTAKTIYF